MVAKELARGFCGGGVGCFVMLSQHRIVGGSVAEVAIRVDASCQRQFVDVLIHSVLSHPFG